MPRLRDVFTTDDCFDRLARNAAVVGQWRHSDSLQPFRIRPDILQDEERLSRLGRVAGFGRLAFAATMRLVSLKSLRRVTVPMR